MVEDHIEPKFFRNLRDEDPDRDNLQYICYDCHVDKTREDLLEIAQVRRELGIRRKKRGPMSEDMKERLRQTHLGMWETRRRNQQLRESETTG